jgi:predicted nuclease of predicted toxin-antitoxin system
VKLKLDENIPASLKGELAAMGHDVHTVVDEALVGSPDEGIWARCQEEGRLLVTQDLDFSDSRKFKPGRHAGLLLVRLQNPGRAALIGWLKAIFESYDVEGWKKCLVVISETKIRIQRNRCPVP